MCETVEAVLSVRFGLNFLGADPVEFHPTKFMFKNFTAIMYEKQNDVCDDSSSVVVDIFSAIEMLEEF